MSVTTESATRATDSTMVSIDGVVKRFRVRTATEEGDIKAGEMMTVLDRVSLDVQSGEFLSLLGPSGCGKTTLLRIVAGLLTLDEGEIRVAGDLVEMPRKDACMVFQDFGLLPWRTVQGNVEFPLELDRVNKGERQDIAANYLGIVGLTGFEGHYPHELSGGMQQRVGIARALMRRPILLLMDEPFGALDAQTREQLQEDFLKIWQDLRTTVIFVTHSIDEALVVSDRIVVMTARPGQIKEIIESPLAADRASGDPRSNPDFISARAHIRGLLRSERK
jgi:NitT/TauT family transport system ATP-binding protein